MHQLMSLILAAAVPWFAQPTVSVVARQVTFSNAGATLHGTLYDPQTAGRHPAVIVFHGASEPLAKTPLYAHLRDGLPQLGIGVLIFDRRGTDASTGSPKVPYQTFTEDGIAGASAVRRFASIDPKRVGYWGISQGGWLATFAASLDPRAAFAVAVSAPLVPAEAQMEFAMSNQLHVLGYGEAQINAMLDARKKIDGYFNGRNSRAVAADALAQIDTLPWFKLMYLPTADELAKDPATSPWRGQMDLDTFAAVERVKIPILFILGSEDPWTPVAKTAARLRAIAATHPLLQYVVVPNANHLMMTPPAYETMSDASAKEVAVEQPNVAAYFMILSSWLERYTRV